jgi:hypothetical protein
MRARSHTLPRRPATALALALAALSIAGCGGGDDTTPTSTATTDLPTGPLSRSELVTEADQLCADSTDRILGEADPPSFGKDGPQPDEVEASADFWRATASEGQVLVDQLSELQPPKSEEQQWAEYVRMLEAGTVDYANSLLGPAEDGDPDAFYQAAVDAQKDLVQLAKASQRLGLEVCGSRDIG